MKAMVLREPGPVEGNPLVRVDLAMPEPAPGQVRLQVSACGVCHTDLHLVERAVHRPAHRWRICRVHGRARRLCLSHPARIP
jgi:D-arabinose 1-dehydrogenase-like Zn-dependent alcohol dehydrogenase